MSGPRAKGRLSHLPREPQGRVIAGKFEIVRPLAEGGMGAVYAARHVFTGVEVALKLLHPEVGQDEAHVERFLREVRFASEIGHPGIVRTIDAGEDEDGTLYLAMELLQGEDLARWLERPSTTAEQALEVILEVLEPLAAAHARGIVHRDLKPENVFIARGEGDRRVVKLLDFGIARQVGANSKTTHGVGLGTTHYMAPEQATSARDVRPAADVWSVGVMLYEAIAGVLPFDGESVHAVVLAACTAPHVPLSEHVPGINGRLAALVDRCLSKRPEQRPADAGALRAELEALLSSEAVRASLRGGGRGGSGVVARSKGPGTDEAARSASSTAPAAASARPPASAYAAPHASSAAPADGGASREESLRSNASPALEVPVDEPGSPPPSVATATEPPSSVRTVQRPRPSSRTLALALALGLGVAVLGAFALFGVLGAPRGADLQSAHAGAAGEGARGSTHAAVESETRMESEGRVGEPPPMHAPASDVPSSAAASPPRGAVGPGGDEPSPDRVATGARGASLRTRDVSARRGVSGERTPRLAAEGASGSQVQNGAASGDAPARAPRPAERDVGPMPSPIDRDSPRAESFSAIAVATPADAPATAGRQVTASRSSETVPSAVAALPPPRLDFSADAATPPAAGTAQLPVSAPPRVPTGAAAPPGVVRPGPAPPPSGRGSGAPMPPPVVSF